MTHPAARITDLHAHGPTVGAIVPPCEPTVLIGTLPAARVSDLAQCGSGLDPIVIGSMSVWIGGMPAARIGDTTALGGVIITGEPTVLIGGTATIGRAFAAAEKSGAALVCKDTCRECGAV